MSAEEGAAPVSPRFGFSVACREGVFRGAELMTIP